MKADRARYRASPSWKPAPAAGQAA